MHRSTSLKQLQTRQSFARGGARSRSTPRQRPVVLAGFPVAVARKLVKEHDPLDVPETMATSAVCGCAF